MDLIKEAEKEIKTGNGFQNDLIATTNHRIKVSIQAISELLKSQEETKGALKSLENTIKKLDDKNDKLQRAFFLLTLVATIFTVLQIIQVIDIVLKWLK